MSNSGGPAGTTILWELAGRDNNLPFLIVLLKKHRDQINEKLHTTGQTLLHCACSYGNREVVLHLMTTGGASLHEKDNLYGYTALHFACFYDKQLIIEEMLRLDQENTEKAFNETDKLGWNCLHHAAKNGNPMIAKILIDHNCLLNAEDEKGKTPVHLAAENGHVETLQLFLKHSSSKASTSPTTDKQGFTALHFAAMNGHLPCVELLKSNRFLPNNTCTCTLDNDTNKERTNLSVAEIANLFGHSNVAAVLRRYINSYETWVKDIEELEPLSHVKLCICGNPQVGKTALQETLLKWTLIAIFSPLASDHDDDPTRKSKGIDVSTLDLGNRVCYQLWDFAGQIESFITHHFFLSTDNTVIVMMVNLSTDEEEIRRQMRTWLRFVKIRNIGATRYHFARQANDLVQFKIPDEGVNDVATPLQKVPVVVVASHLDQAGADTKIPKVERLVEEMKEIFIDSLDIEPKLYPLNCLNARSPDLTNLKDHLVKMHSSVKHLQRKYPRVVRLVDEYLKRQHNSVKLLSTAELYSIVREEVNGLLSENQFNYICKILSNTGKVVYSDKGAQAHHICLDPSWLCRDVLGTTLAPREFEGANLVKEIGKSLITEQELVGLLGEFANPHADALIQLLTNFELCCRLSGSDPATYEFPCFVTTPLDLNDWQNDPIFLYHHGRQIQCREEQDCFPPGLFSRLQVKVRSMYPKAEQIKMFRDSFIVYNENAQCIVKTDEMNEQITFISRCKKIVRTGQQNALGKPDPGAHQCILLVDILHSQLYRLLKVACPNISTKWQVLSAVDLKAYSDDPCVYTTDDIIEAVSEKVPFVHKITGQKEEIVDVFFCGCEHIHDERSGKNMPVAFLSSKVLDGMEELLVDEIQGKNWMDLCKELGMVDYAQLFQNKAPNSTKALLRKYGENPRRKVHGLIDALNEIGRQEVTRWLETRLGIYRRKE